MGFWKIDRGCSGVGEESMGLPERSMGLTFHGAITGGRHAEQSIILLTRERCRTVIISSRHHTYSIKVEKLSEPAGTFQICFWYFISFNMKSFFLKIFKMNQTEVVLNMKVFLHNVPSTKGHDIYFEKTTTQKSTFLSQA